MFLILSKLKSIRFKKSPWVDIEINNVQWKAKGSSKLYKTIHKTH